MVSVKRVYEPASKGDGFRILVDRLWPRGISKRSGFIDLWCKEIAPSTTLRKWFGHDPGRWDAFRKKYLEELEEQRELINELKHLEKQHRVITLLFGAKDEEHNQAVILRDVLSRKRSA